MPHPLRLLALASLLLPFDANAKPATVKVTDAWCRAAPLGAPAGGCYVTLTASGEDRLVAVETPGADHGEIHTMSLEGGVMRMRRLAEGVVLPAGQAVLFKPGDKHLMIIGPKAPMAAGTRVKLVLRFRNAPAVALAAPVRTVIAPAAAPGMEQR
jgi:copper(I)-binding protein